ncbi:MAG: hypothetical protein K2Y51_20490 [Gammaproteobacteria bacterium]|nr:hypothetical protein [Gammaproteobacteria bacterium]
MIGLASFDQGPEKPAFGAPCNGRWHCCALNACAVVLEYISKDIHEPGGKGFAEDDA